jgi:hypothetical protein
LVERIELPARLALPIFDLFIQRRLIRVDKRAEGLLTFFELVLPLFEMFQPHPYLRF